MTAVKTCVLALVLFALPPTPANASTYYVDSLAGNDRDSGTAPARVDDLPQGPWKTIGRVNSQRLAAGDTVLFRRGGVWRDTLLVDESGRPGLPITFGAYGTGNAPVISGSDVLSGWPAPDRAAVSCLKAATEPQVLFIADRRGRRRTSSKELTGPGEWAWNGGTVCVRFGGTAGERVDAGARGSAIAILGQSAITVQDLVLERTNGSGLYVVTADRATSEIVVSRVVARESRHAGLTFKNGHPALRTVGVRIRGNQTYGNGGSGINVSEGVNDVTIADNVSHHNSWAGDLYEAGIRVWARQRDAEGLIIERNETYANHFSASGWDNGHGIWVDEVADGAIVRDNVSHDNENAGIYVEHSRRVLIYGNLVERNRGPSIMLYRGVERNVVFNNTIVGGASGIRLAGDGKPRSVLGNVVVNNIVAGEAPFRLMAGDGGENDGVKGSGNVYAYNNLGAQREAMIVWGYGVTKASYSAWDAASGQPSHAVQGDPGFMSQTDRRLRPESRCRNAAMPRRDAERLVGARIAALLGSSLGAFQP